MQFVREFWKVLSRAGVKSVIPNPTFLIGLIWHLRREKLRENCEHLFCTSGQNSHSRNISEVFVWDQRSFSGYTFFDTSLLLLSVVFDLWNLCKDSFMRFLD